VYPHKSGHEFCARWKQHSPCCFKQLAIRGDTVCDESDCEDCTMKTFILSLLFAVGAVADEPKRYISVAPIGWADSAVDQRTHVFKETQFNSGQREYSIFIRTNAASSVTAYRPLQVTYAPSTNIVVFASTDTNMHVRLSAGLYAFNSNNIARLRSDFPAATIVKFTEVKTSVTATIRLPDGTEYKDVDLDEERVVSSKKEIIP